MILATVAALSMMQTGPLQGQALLDDMSRRAVQFFWDQSHPTTGFTKDRANNSSTPDNFTVSSIASTGFSMIALAVGAERGWLDRNQALARARLTMKSVRTKAPKANGWVYHWMHWQTGTRQWNSEVSSIDTSIFLAGAIVADAYFNDPELRSDFTTWLNSINWYWMLTDGGSKPTSKSFCMGWVPESGWITARWDDYSEQRMLLLQAMGDDTSIPDTVWTSFKREFVPYYGMMVMEGGPIFLHQMSESFVDFTDKEDGQGHLYWDYSRTAFLANRKYCMVNPKGFAGYGPNYWGLNACDTPDGYRAPGAPGWGMNEDNGTISPTGIAATVNHIPTQAFSALNHIITTYPNSYGRYGFANGINAHRNWIGPHVIGIDLGMAMCAIENRRDRFVWKQSEKNAIMKRGEQRAKLKKLVNRKKTIQPEN